MWILKVGKPVALTRHRTGSVIFERLVAVPEERFQELVTAEVAYLATVPVKAVSMRQAGGDVFCLRL